MKIAEISKADMAGGGASRVADEIATGLRAGGDICHHWMKSSSGGFDCVERFPLHRGRFQRVRNKVMSIAARLGYPDLVPDELPKLAQSARKYDLLHFHDLSSAISPFTLRWLARRHPVVWTFHDCSPFTAGCLYPFECEKYKTGCGGCPQIGVWPLSTQRDRTRTLCAAKAALHREGRVVTVAPSAWMADMAMGSGMLKKRPLVVSNGVDTEVFRPRNNADIKAYLGINRKRPVVLIMAHSLNDKRKGVDFSISALQSVKDLNPFVLLIGNTNKDFVERMSGLDCLSLGYISSQTQMSFWYGAADLFLFCSLADNMPLAILETMACGVPTVGFRTGGIPEMIEQNITGFLVAQKDQKALNEALRRTLTDGSFARWGVESRRKAVDEYSMDRFISAHKALYAETIDSFQAQKGHVECAE